MPVSFSSIAVGSSWSRQALSETWGYKAYQAIARGVVTPANDNKIILFVTEQKQSTATKYEDILQDDILKWEGPTGHSAEDRVVGAGDRNDEIHLFHRTRHHTDFVYRGQLRLLSTELHSDRPSRFVFEVLDASRNTWSRDQLLSAVYLYTLLTPQQLVTGDPRVENFALGVGKSVHAVAAKLRSFALLDPLLTARGFGAVDNVTQLDRSIWDEFQKDWTSTILLASRLYEDLEIQNGAHLDPSENAIVAEGLAEYGEGLTREAIVQLRLNQKQFRTAVLNSYGSTCCISGLTNEKLLVASHIVRWADDKSNRLNPQNGLCLSALHDRAFDAGLITVLPNYTVCVHPDVRRLAGVSALADVLASCANTKIRMPGRFAPDPRFLAVHATRFRFM